MAFKTTWRTLFWYRSLESGAKKDSLSSVLFNLLQLWFSACVAPVKCRPVLHHCVVIFFWSLRIMGCMLFTFEKWRFSYAPGASVLCHISLPLINSLKKTKAAFISLIQRFLCHLFLLRDIYGFLKMYCWGHIFQINNLIFLKYLDCVLHTDCECLF